MSVMAKFFRDGDVNRVELVILTDQGNTSIREVEPDHIKAFPREWEAFEKGLDKVDYGGTPLTEVPGIDAGMLTAYRLKNVHNVEMLADLSDAAAHNLGLGAVTARNAARLVIKAKRADALEAVAAAAEKAKGGK